MICADESGGESCPASAMCVPKNRTTLAMIATKTSFHVIFAGFSAGWLFRSIDQYWESVKRDISWSLNAGAGCTTQREAAATHASVTLGTRRDDNLSIGGLLAASCGQQMELELGGFCRSPETRARNGGDRGMELGYSVAQFVEAVVPVRCRQRCQRPQFGLMLLPAAAARRRNAALVQRFGNHESRRTTKLYDRTGDEITLDEIERITT